ncbi:MAG TPA: tetratricopeptide repeat protein, partial [Acidobacteriota bacterium]|nr:tetratricopeptide repeat protein [Acidobacteriota bacterium]
MLSSWKEIAAYLGCDERTCARWEKTLGLPVHRFEGAQKSRVYAYRHELEAWRKSQDNDHSLDQRKAGGAPAWRIAF